MEKNQLVVEIAMEVAFPKNLLEEIAHKIGPEMGRECAMSTSVGGIGPLLKDRILGQAEKGISVIGTSLLYESVWVQKWHEWGQMNLEKRPVGDTLRKFLKPTDLGFDLPGYDKKLIHVDVWACPYGSATVYFLSSTEITNVVYPGPRDLLRSKINPHVWAHEQRLKQSWVLGRGTLALLKKLGMRPSVIVLSETPTIFGHHQLVQDEFQKDSLFSDTAYIFNDHTPLEYAHPIWDAGTIEMARMDPALYTGSFGWNASKKTLDITALLIGSCDGVFGVAKKHGEVMRAMNSLKKYASKIEYITNGVKKEEWQAATFRNYETLSDEVLIKEKQVLKEKLLDWVWRQSHMWPQWAKKAKTMNVVTLTRRITPYKRMDVLTRMLTEPNFRERFLKLNTLVLAGGRIHQQDNQAQDMVYSLIDLVEKDDRLKDRIIFIDNFNVLEAPLLYQGANGSIMMADDTREASATGFMKAQMNGAAVIATLDGAIPEFVVFEEKNGEAVNGFLVPYEHGEPTPTGLIEAFEAFDKAMGTPATQAALMRAAFAMVPRLDISRTVDEMIALYGRALLTRATPPPQMAA